MSDAIDEATTKKEIQELRTLIFSVDKNKEILKALDEGGWHIRRSGPYTDDNLFPKVDMKRRLLIVSRNITNVV